MLGSARVVLLRGRRLIVEVVSRVVVLNLRLRLTMLARLQGGL